MKKITVLIPSYNEEESLPLLMHELYKVTDSLSEYEWEYLFVNDGSGDNTLQIIKELRQQDNRVSYVDLSRNFGKENAMLAGFDYAQGDAVIIMDADLQHPPTVIPEMLIRWEEGWDDIYAERLSRGKESYLRKWFSLLYYRILQGSTRMEVLPNVGDFRLLDRKCINALKRLRESGRYTKGMYCYIGFRKTSVKFETRDRMAGQSSMNYNQLLRLALEGITSYTTTPLRWATYLGLLVSISAFAYMLFVLLKAMLYGDPVAGYPTLMIVILFLGGVQLLTIGIIGEYLGRVFNEVKHRPVYIVREYNNSFVDNNIATKNESIVKS